MLRARRFTAYMIDVAVIVPILGTWLWMESPPQWPLLDSIAQWKYPHFSRSMWMPASVGASTLYMLFRDSIGGAGIGKRIMGLEVVWKKPRRTIGFVMSGIRSALFAVSPINLIDSAVWLLSKRSQRLTDSWMGIEVVRAKD